jgi:lysophospholipase L1-like esterase
MIRSLLTAALLCMSVSAQAQTAPPQGMVDNPCAGVPVVPDSVMAYMQSIYVPGRTGPLPAYPPEAATYRAAALEWAKTDWGNLCRYRADNERLLAGPASGRQVVFMGDSITQAWPFADAALFANGVVNRGISGQTSPQMVLRFMSDVVALHPRVVHIMAGTNDLAGNTGPNSAADYKNNIITMVTLAKANGIRVILASIPPTAGFTWKPDVKPVLLAPLNAWLKDYAAKQGLIFVDYAAVLRTPEGALKPEFTFDGVHPNYEGYAAMAPLTRAALAKAMKS